jgi:hypothetical protein
MKLIYTALLAFTLAGTYNATAQASEKPKQEKLTKGPEYDKHYEKLKELHIKQLSSESHKTFSKLHKLFIKKMKFKGNLVQLNGKYFEWIKENLANTTFESYEAAEKEWQVVQAANQANIKENKDYYDYISICLSCCDIDLISQVTIDVMQEQPELVFGE